MPSSPVVLRMVSIHKKNTVIGKTEKWGSTTDFVAWSYIYFWSTWHQTICPCEVLRSWTCFTIITKNHILSQRYLCHLKAWETTPSRVSCTENCFKLLENFYSSKSNFVKIAPLMHTFREIHQEFRSNFLKKHL